VLIAGPVVIDSGEQALLEVCRAAWDLCQCGLQQGEGADQIGRVDRELQRDDSAEGVSSDMRCWHLDMPEQSGGVAGVSSDARGAVSERAVLEPRRW